MRVLITIPRKNTGGVANYYNTIKNKFSCDVEYISRGSSSEQEKKIDKIKRIISDYMSFAIKIIGGRYDVVLINTSFGKKSLSRDLAYILLMQFVGTKTLLFIHGWDSSYVEDFFLNTKVRKKVLTSCDSYVVLAENFKDVLKNNGISKPIYCLSTVVADEVFDKKNFSKGGDNSYEVLYLSRLEKEKGVFEALKTYQILKNTHQNLRMTIAGDGSELDEIKNKVLSDGIDDVTITGYVVGNEKENIFREADIYLFPTYYGEGMPTTVLEAMAWGLPIITRPVGGIKDFFQDGKMGYITESKDPEVFAKLMDKLLMDYGQLELISIYNREYAKNNFTASRVTQKIENILVDIIN